MAISYLTSALISAGTSSTNSPGTPYSFDSGATGSDRIAVFFALIEQGSTKTDNVTAMTYNGVSCTEAVEGLPGGGGAAFAAVSIWYIVNPATGSNTLAVTWDEEGVDYMLGGVVFTGVDQSTPLGDTGDVYSDAAQTLETSTEFVTTGSNSMAVLAGWVNGGNRTPCAPAGTETEIAALDGQTASGAAGFAYWAGYEAIASPATTVIGFSSDGVEDEEMGLAVIELLVASAGGANPKGPLGMPISRPLAGPMGI